MTLHGHDHYLGPHGSEESKREYERLVMEYLASGGGPIVQRGKLLTVEEVVAAYLDGHGRSCQWSVRLAADVAYPLLVAANVFDEQHPDEVRYVEAQPTGRAFQATVKVIRAAEVDISAAPRLLVCNLLTSHGSRCLNRHHRSTWHSLTPLTADEKGFDTPNSTGRTIHHYHE